MNPLWNKTPFSPGGGGFVGLDHGNPLGGFGCINFIGGGVTVSVGPTGCLVVDIETGAGIAAGDGLVEGPPGTVNVGANADGSIVVNADDIQVSAAIQAGAALGATSLQFAGNGLTEAPAGQVNVGANADGSIIVNADDIQVNPALLSPTGGLGYLTQAAWFVNSATGNDANDGATALTPLLTLAELARRFSGRVANTAITVDLAGDFPTQMLHSLTSLTAGQRITWRGTPTTQATGVVTAFTATNAATSQDARLADTTTPIVWAAHVQRRVRLTSGANVGAFAWVLADLGANTARVSQFISPTTLAAVSPAVNDTFAVETLGTRIAGIDCLLLNGVGSVENLAIEADAPGGRLSFAQCPGSASQFLITGCRIQTQQLGFVIGSNPRLNGCSNAATLSSGLASLIISAHAAFATVLANQGRIIFAVAASFLQNAQIQANLGAFVSVQAAVGSFDRTGVGAFNIVIDVLAQMDNSAILWGLNNTNTGGAVQVRSRGGISWNSAGNQPTVTSTGGDVVLGGAVAVSWATIAAAGQSSMWNLNNGAMAGLRS